MKACYLQRNNWEQALKFFHPVRFNKTTSANRSVSFYSEINKLEWQLRQEVRVDRMFCARVTVVTVRMQCYMTVISNLFKQQLSSIEFVVSKQGIASISLYFSYTMKSPPSVRERQLYSISLFYNKKSKVLVRLA